MRYSGLLVIGAAMVGGYMEDEILTFWELLTLASVGPVIEAWASIRVAKIESRRSALEWWLGRKRDDET